MIKEERNAIETAKNELHVELSDVKQGRAALDQRLDDATAEILALTMKRDLQADELERLKTSNAALEKTAESAITLDKEVTKLQAELLSSQGKGIRLQQRLDFKIKAHEVALEKINGQNAKAALTAKALSETRKSLQDQQKRATELDQRCRKAACERDAALACQADNKERMAQLSADKSKFWEEIRTMRKGRDEATVRRKKIEDELADSQKLVQSLRSENEELIAELQEARDTVDSIRKFTERVRTTDSVKKGRLTPGDHASKSNIDRSTGPDGDEVPVTPSRLRTRSPSCGVSGLELASGSHITPPSDSNVTPFQDRVRSPEAHDDPKRTPGSAAGVDASGHDREQETSPRISFPLFHPHIDSSPKAASPLCRADANPASESRNPFDDTRSIDVREQAGTEALGKRKRIDEDSRPPRPWKHDVNRYRNSDSSYGHHSRQYYDDRGSRSAGRRHPPPRSESVYGMRG